MLNLAEPLAFWAHIQGLYTRYSNSPMQLAEDGGKVLAIYLTLYTGNPSDAQTAQALADLDTLARGQG